MTHVRDPEDFRRMVDRKRSARMARIDAMPPELRELVHEYGLLVVDALVAVGVTKPRQIRHVVECVMDELSPTRGSFSKQGLRVPIDTALSERQP